MYLFGSGVGVSQSEKPSSKFKTIIACSFYSPPNKMKNSKMADHIVSTLHMLYSKYPEWEWDNPWGR